MAIPLAWNNRSVEDLTGRRFGRLVVTSFAERRPDKGGNLRIWWNTLCDCGIAKPICGGDLKYSNQSCGCFRREICGIKAIERAAVKRANRNPVALAAVALFANQKFHAKKRGYSWELSFKEAMTLWTSDCAYCGALPSNATYSKQRGERFGPFIYTGIDRIDNTLGYSVANSRPSCIQCNIAKHTHTEAEFFAWIRRVHERLVA